MEQRRFFDRVTPAAFTLMLFTLFAVLSLLQVLCGAGIYKRVVTDMDDGYSLRASLNYVANKLHAQDGSGEVNIQTVDNVDVLCLWDDAGETVVCIYFYENALMEQYITSQTPFDPAMGQKITELAEFRVSIDDAGGVSFTAWTWSGTMRTMNVVFRSENGASDALQPGTGGGE